MEFNFADMFECVVDAVPERDAVVRAKLAKGKQRPHPEAAAP